VQYYPVFLDLRGRPCAVVGGGAVAARKVEGLLAAGARVTVVSPEATPALIALAETHEIVWHQRPYRRGDLAGAALAYAATGDERVHAQVAAEAAESGVWLNVVDRPALCAFIVPALLRRGAITVAVSTGGASPALAQRLRDDLERAVGSEYAVAATILAKLRPLVGEREPDQTVRARMFTALVASPLLDAVRAGDERAVDATLGQHLGAGTTLAALGIRLDGTAPA
jgi:siroheme synthase-like protein